MSLAQVAKHVGVHRSLVAHFEQGRRGIRPELLVSMLELYSPTPFDKERTQTFVTFELRTAHYRRFPELIQLVTDVVDTSEEQFMELMRGAEPKERQQLAEYLSFLRFMTQYRASKTLGN